MRKLILATALFSIAAMSHASNPICDGKYSQAERAQCYSYAVNGGMTRMKGNYKRIQASAKIPQNEKDYINVNHNEWAKAAESQCRGSDVCLYGEISKRNSEIEGYMRQHKLTPM